MLNLPSALLLGTYFSVLPRTHLLEVFREGTWARGSSVVISWTGRVSRWGILCENVILRQESSLSLYCLMGEPRNPADEEQERCVYVHTYVVAIRRNKWLGLPEWMTGWCGWWVVWNAHPCREADSPVGGGGDRWEQSSSLSETDLGFQTKLSVAPWEISGSLLFGCRLHFKFRVKYSYENEKLGYSSGEENLFQHSLP